MQCYTELLPPTTVTHAVTLPFLSANEENLVVAKTSLLQVYRLRQAPTDGKTGESTDDEEHEAIERKLSLVGEYKLSGTITALQRVKILNGKSGGDALLISSKDAKLSLVDWDPENHRINTISIHYYEGENIPTQPFGPALRDSESILTVDPSSRCAALKFGQRHLAILPFRQPGDDLADLEAEADNDERRLPQHGSISTDAAQTPYKASFVSTLTQVAPNLTHTRYSCFSITSFERSPGSTKRHHDLHRRYARLGTESIDSARLCAKPSLRLMEGHSSFVACRWCTFDWYK
jgi:cleavage and polyadenylation specificity factor subunit 1